MTSVIDVALVKHDVGTKRERFWKSDQYAGHDFCEGLGTNVACNQARAGVKDDLSSRLAPSGHRSVSYMPVWLGKVDPSVKTIFQLI